MGQTRIEVAVKGKWFTVPALEVDGKFIISTGKLIKTAVIEAEEWLETELADPEKIVGILKNQRRSGLCADIFSFAQKLPNTEPKYRYHFEWDSVAAIRLTTFEGWWNSLPQESRKNVRRSQKRGVVVTASELNDKIIRDIHELNNDSPLRQGKSFTHYGKSLEEVEKDQQSFLDRSIYICAYSANELLGVTKLVYRGDVASILTFLPKASQSDKRPANAMMAKAVELCTERGLSHLIFGMFNYGNKRHTSLREFKIRNSFEEILVPHYYVPVNLRGAVAIKLNAHRGLIGILPHSVISTLVGLRTRYNEFRMSRCSSTPERPKCNRQMECSSPPAGSKTLLP